MSQSVDARALLADATQAGAYFVELHDTDAMAEAASGLDFKVLRVALAGVNGKDDVLQAIAQALEFPEWFGGNFDALADCLGDLSWLPGAGYLVLFDGVDGWRDADDENFATLLDVLNEAAVSWSERDVPFWSLLPLPAEQLGALGP
ncbi:barstar family protein [Lysobacter fragariae]